MIISEEELINILKEKSMRLISNNLNDFLLLFLSQTLHHSVKHRMFLFFYNDDILKTPQIDIK